MFQIVSNVPSVSNVSMFQITEKIGDPYAQKLGPIARHEGVKGGRQRGETRGEREEKRGAVQSAKNGAEIHRGAAGRRSGPKTPV